LLLWATLSKEGSISSEDAVLLLKKGFLMSLVTVQTYLLLSSHVMSLLVLVTSYEPQSAAALLYSN
jgi:hypothetical protein